MLTDQCLFAFFSSQRILWICSIVICFVCQRITKWSITFIMDFHGLRYLVDYLWWDLRKYWIIAPHNICQQTVSRPLINCRMFDNFCHPSQLTVGRLSVIKFLGVQLVFTKLWNISLKRSFGLKFYIKLGFVDPSNFVCVIFHFQLSYVAEDEKGKIVGYVLAKMYVWQLTRCI